MNRAQERLLKLFAYLQAQQMADAMNALAEKLKREREQREAGK